MKSAGTLAALPLPAPSGLATSRLHDLSTSRRNYIGVLIFIGSEVMFFAGLISAFLVLRASQLAWPPPGQPRLPVTRTALNTAVLLLSGYLVHRAYVAVRSGDRRASLRWLGAGWVCGVAFLLLQGAEWVRLLGEGLTASSSVYGALFYTIIGTHGLHVTAGAAALLWAGARAHRAERPEAAIGPIALSRLFWLFVVGLWPVLYVLVYLT